MRKLARFAGRLVVVLLLAVVGLMVTGSRRLARGVDVPPHTAPAASATPEAIEQGKHLATALACAHCHGPQMEGTDFIVGGPFMNLPAPNLSGGRVTAAVIERAVRHGVGSDGRALLIMPSRALAAMPDDDVAAISAYILSLPDVPSTLIKRSVGPIGRAVAAFQAPALQSARTIEHVANHPSGSGTAITRYTPMCADCHGADFGGQVFAAEKEYWAANLTKHPTGAGSWTREQFADALQRGRTPDGRTLDETDMPWKSFAGMTDAEVDSIFAYLQSRPAVDRPRPTK